MNKILSFLVLISINSYSQTVELGIDSLSIYESNFQYLKAISYLDRVYRGKEMPKNLKEKKAIFYSKIGKNAEAVKIYKDIFALDTLSISTGVDLAQQLTKQKKYKEAQTLYESLIMLDSSNFYLNRNLALVYFRNKKPYKAIKTYYINHDIDSTDIETILSIAKIFLKQEHALKASQWASKGLKIDPSNIDLLFTKAKAEHLRKYNKGAIDLLDEILVQGDTLPEYARLSGVCNFDINNYKKAIFWFSKFDDALNETEVIHYYLGKSYQELGDDKKAEKHFRKAMQLGTSAYMTSYYELLAYNYIGQKKYKHAISTWEKLYVLEPDVKYLFYVGNIYETYLNDYKTALNYYHRVLDIDKDLNSPTRNKASRRITEVKKQMHFRDELLFYLMCELKKYSLFVISSHSCNLKL